MSQAINDIYKIQKAIREKTLVVFVGAGVSANSGVPTWSGLIDKMAKELGIKRKIRQDEYLKIAQYYYNEHPKTFNSSVKKYLDGNWKPNIINEYLFSEFNPKYFVTTNYDDLLEQTSNKLTMPYTIIVQDEDIPKISNDNAIIKMHGDFQHKMFVLKEDDYLKYSENFRLMEVFIKSLFATNTILFVGFSADDPNVNQIYSWVNNILQKNQREAYLLQIGIENNGCDALKRKYFNKKGIRIVNYNELTEQINNFAVNKRNVFNNIKSLKDKRGKQLYKLLYFIKNTTPNILEQCYQKLLPTKHLNFVSNYDIEKILDKYWFCRNGTLEARQDEQIGDFIDFLKKQTKKTKVIKELLAHLGIKQLVESEWTKENIKINNKITINSIKKQENKVLNFINEFNYIEAEKLLGNIDNENYINDYIDKNINSVNVFEKVYILSKLHRYEEAYNLLKRVSYKAKEKNNNFIFVISEFNRKVIFNYYHWSCYYKSSIEKKKELDAIRKECWAVNIPNLVKTLLSSEERNVIEDKLNFEFINKLDRKILRETAEDSNPEFCLKELYNTFIKNYIFIDNSQEFEKLCIHSISPELKTINAEEKSFNFFGLLSINSNKYNFLDLILIIKYAKISDLNNLVYENKIKQLPLSDHDVKDKLLAAYKNLINSILYFNLCSDRSNNIKYLNYIYKFFIIFMLLPLDKDDTSYIITNYLKLIKKYNWHEDFYATHDLLFYILNFIVRHHNATYNKKSNLDVNVLSEFLTYVINNVHKTKKAAHDKYRVRRFVEEVAGIIWKINPNFKTSSFDVSIKTTFSVQLYCLVYKISDTSTKNKIKNCIIKELNKNFNYYLYQVACLENTIKPLVKYEHMLLKEIEKRIVEYKKLKISKPTTRSGFTNNPIGLDEIHDVLRTVANLLNFEKIKKPELFKQYLKHKDFTTYNYFSFALNMETFDYNNFELDFLYYLTLKKRKQLKEIIEEDLSKKQIIKEKFISKISLNNDLNNRLRDKILNLLFDDFVME